MTSGSHQDIFSQGVGYLCFVRSNKEEEEVSTADDSNEIEELDTHNTDSIDISSKSVESLQTELYRKLIFHPFVEKIRKTCYGYDGNEECIPTELTAVSWCDGCGTQLNPITSENNMKIEKKLKIVCNKHSAARTAVEQAADTGSMFKSLKSLLKKMEVPTISNNSIYHYLFNTIESMSPSKVGPSDQDVICMPSFKKNQSLQQSPTCL